MSPEGVAAYWTSQSTMLRLQDLGIYHLYRTANGVSNLHAALAYLNGQVSAARKRLNHLKKKKKKGLIPNDRLLEYEEVEKKLTEHYNNLKRKGEVATFIYEELQLASWKITGDFIDVHKKGNGEMQLTGLGDPSGINAAYNFVRKIGGKFPTQLINNILIITQSPTDGQFFIFRDGHLKKTFSSF